MIDDESSNTESDPGTSDQAVSQGEERAGWGLVRESTMKPVGKPDAGNRHVRFDERGGETGRCHQAQATAPLLDSTPNYRNERRM